ncbi:MAG: SDR family oxidoreductase [Agarilytica sp.]
MTQVKPSQKLAGKVALITGAGRGIGREIALKLASEGASLVVNDLDEAPIQEVLKEAERFGGKYISCCGNVTKEDFGETFVATAIEAFGRIDIIVNNAGYTWDNVIQKMTDEQWGAVQDVHLTAPFRILRAAQPHFKKQALEEAQAGVEGFRKVVNISSVVGLSGNPGQANYAAAKAGLIGLTKTLAKEWGRYRVNVNSVSFGLIETRLTTENMSDEKKIDIDGREIKVGVKQEMYEMSKLMIPLGRAGTPSEAAGAVYLLCTPESNYISGQVLVCGGGFEM